MFCKNCGQQIQDGSMVCPHCGQGMAPAAPQAPVQAVESHMTEAILTTLFCCLPFGVVAIIYAAQVSSLAASGNIAGAQQASQNAHKWAMVSLIVGLVAGIIYFLLNVLGIAAASA